MQKTCISEAILLWQCTKQCVAMWFHSIINFKAVCSNERVLIITQAGGLQVYYSICDFSSCACPSLHATLQLLTLKVHSTEKQTHFTITGCQYTQSKTQYQYSVSKHFSYFWSVWMKEFLSYHYLCALAHWDLDKGHTVLHHTKVL